MGAWRWCLRFGGQSSSEALDLLTGLDRAPDSLRFLVAAFFCLCFLVDVSKVISRLPSYLLGAHRANVLPRCGWVEECHRYGGYTLHR